MEGYARPEGVRILFQATLLTGLILLAGTTSSNAQPKAQRAAPHGETAHGKGDGRGDHLATRQDPAL